MTQSKVLGSNIDGDSFCGSVLEQETPPYVNTAKPGVEYHHHRNNGLGWILQFLCSGIHYK